jgi:hypothetical protein
VSVDATTTVTGGVAGNDVASGSLGIKTYAAVLAHQQYDLPPNSASIDVATGTRIFRV